MAAAELDYVSVRSSEAAGSESGDERVTSDSPAVFSSHVTDDDPNEEDGGVDLDAILRATHKQTWGESNEHDEGPGSTSVSPGAAPPLVDSTLMYPPRIELPPDPFQPQSSTPPAEEAVQGDESPQHDASTTQNENLEVPGDDVFEEEDEDDDDDEGSSLRSRSPNLARLIERRLHSQSESERRISRSESPINTGRESAANTTVGVFINGKLSGHSEMRSILTSHYLAINSLGVLGNFTYRLRVSELPDCVAVMNCGDIVIADNCLDIKRLKFFDSNQRYQRSLPLLPESSSISKHTKDPFVTDIQLSDSDTRLWMCDNANHVIREIDLTSGQVLQSWPDIDAKETLVNPGKLTINSEKVFVCDAGDEFVKVFSRTAGEFLYKFKVGQNGSCPWAIHWTHDETLLIGDLRFNFIYIVDQFGNQIGMYGGEGKEASKFNGPVSICSDGDGNIAVADCKNGRVQILARDMLWITELYPVEPDDDLNSICVSSDGMLVVLDHSHNECLIF